MRVWCRAVVLRGFVYLVRDHTRPTVPRGRSAAALRDDGEVSEILVLSDRTRVGKGLEVKFVWCLYDFYLLCELIGTPHPERTEDVLNRKTPARSE